MAIEKNLMRTAGATSIDHSNSARVTEEYRIEQTDGTNLTYQKIKAELGLIPEFGRRYSGTSAVLTEYDVRPEPLNRSVWYLTLTYETRNAEIDNDPMKQPAQVWYGTRSYNESILNEYDENDTRDNPSKSIVNTAGDPYDPALVEQKSDLVVYVEKNYRDFDPGDITEFQNTINKDEVTIGGVKFRAEQGLMAVMKHRLMFDENGDQYDRMHFEIVKRDDKWRKRGLSRGFWQYTDGDSNKKNPIKDGDLNPNITDKKQKEKRVSTPKALKSNGAVATSANEVAIQKFLTKWRANWNKLDLPTQKDGRR